MKQEIELKFVLQNSHVAALREVLQQMAAPVEHLPACSLVSTYYDTADEDLRQQDLGLRVRQMGQQYEMTMKLAGQVHGGLHQRAEYTVALVTDQPDLSQFPPQLWAEKGLAAMSAEQLQPALVPLFSTCFQRERWHVCQASSRIEVALDEGEVRAASEQEPLCELELELLEGEVGDVLALARVLAAQPGLRQSNLSKAARGYLLARGSSASPQEVAQAAWQCQPQPILTLPAKADINQGLAAALELTLDSWLYYEECWLRGNAEAKAQVQGAIARARHCLALFGGIVPRKPSAQLRDFLSRAETALNGEVAAQETVFSAPLCTARLELMLWIGQQGWREGLEQAALASLAGSFKRFADIQLSRQAAELKTTFARSLHNRYQDQLPRLARVLDSVHMLSGAYSEARVRGWLENWQMLQQAISLGNKQDCDRFRQLAISQPPFWLHSGKKA